MILWLALALAVAVFALFPGVDLEVSRYFFDGVSFPVAHDALISHLRLLLYAGEDFGAASSLLLAFWAAWRGRAVLGLAMRDWAYSFAVFALGPGLLVNGMLKPLWGRARPDHVTEFGGPSQFTPFWQISGQCQSNCAFTSGEAAGAVALAILLGLLVCANRARLGVAFGLCMALTAAIPLFTIWQRVAAGRHFLSDVLFGALFVAILALYLQPLRKRAAAPQGQLTSRVQPPRSRVP